MVALTLLLMISGWAAAAAAMLWGMLRIARRHSPAAQTDPRPAQAGLDRSRRATRAAFSSSPLSPLRAAR